MVALQAHAGGQPCLPCNKRKPRKKTGSNPREWCWIGMDRYTPTTNFKYDKHILISTFHPIRCPFFNFSLPSFIIYLLQHSYYFKLWVISKIKQSWSQRIFIISQSFLLPLVSYISIFFFNCSYYIFCIQLGTLSLSKKVQKYN